MFPFFQRFLRRKNVLSAPGKKDPARYDREKTTSVSGDSKKRLSLAGSNKTHQEILYYLAEHDSDPVVRLAVAKNMMTPVQASVFLARDRSIDVRMALAYRLVTLLPELTQEKHSQLYAFAVQAMGTLALDEVLKIRLALSSALKDHAHAPPKVAGQLARDVEREVSEPILRFCTALADEDLIDILRGHPASWAVQAIAARPSVSGPVSQAVIDTDDRPAGKILLENKGALITSETLLAVIEKARNYPEWQGAVAQRKSLPPAMAKELAKFADASVRDVLTRRNDFDEETAQEIAAIVQRRLDFAGDIAGGDETPAQRASRLSKEGRLNEETISDALAMRDHDFVQAALAGLARTNIAKVKKIFDMHAAKPIVALCWKAGLSMRMALRLQQEMGKVPVKELVYPREGTDYPMTKAELVWQLEFLGLKK